VDRQRFARLLLLAAALVVAVALSRRWPRAQTIHYVLGDAAAHIEQLDARWAPIAGAGDAPGEEPWTREVAYHFARGQAPRVVTHEPRLADGDYLVEVELAADETHRSIVRKRVVLSGGVTQIELASSDPSTAAAATAATTVPR
jgi:hypothetical protein